MSETNSHVPKKRKIIEKSLLPKATRQRSETKKWFYEEESMILNYILESEKSGHEFEKPTAAIYYKRLLEKLSLSNVNIIQIKNKTKNLRTKLYAANDWENNAGQGVDEDQLVEMCPHYKVLKEIFGHKRNFKIPFQHDTLEPHADKINVNQDLQVENDIQTEDDNVRFGENELTDKANEAQEGIFTTPVYYFIIYATRYVFKYFNN